MPWQNLSDNSLYSIVLSVLVVYNINVPVNKLRKPKQLEANYTSRVLSYVLFLCSLQVSIHSLADIPYLSNWATLQSYWISDLMPQWLSEALLNKYAVHLSLVKVPPLNCCWNDFMLTVTAVFVIHVNLVQV